MGAMIIKDIIFGNTFFLRRKLSLFLMIFLFSINAYSEDKVDEKAKVVAPVLGVVTESKSGEAEKSDKKKSLKPTDLQTLDHAKSKGKADAFLEEDPLLTSQFDTDKVMEQALQETITKELKTYYPIIHSIGFESNEDLLVIEVSYDQSSASDVLNIQSDLIKGAMRAEINFKSPLLQKKDDVKIEGDHQFIEVVNLTPNLSLSSKLGTDAKLFFVKQMQFQLLRPVRWKIKQTPGFLRIEIRPYLAGDEEPIKKPEEDLLFQAPALETTAPILGESYSRELQYERTVVSGGEPTLLENLEAGGSVKDVRQKITDYQYGLSEDAVKEDMKSRYPTFGSLDYWKKHLNGLISNTAQFSKQQRKKSFYAVDTPGIAVAFNRKGVADTRLAYSVQRELPFFYGTLHREKRLAPMDGFMSHNFQGGIVLKTQSPWLYSIQNQWSIGTSENLGASEKFGDRLTTYQYVAGQGLRYSLKRGYVQFGSGLRWQTSEQGGSVGVNGYLSSLWVRPWTKKIATSLEHDYTHTFLPRLALDVNVHKMYLGLDYKLSKNIKLSPRVGWAFYDGEAFAGLVGGFNYRHQLNPRDNLTISYSTDLIRTQGNNFGSESLSGTRSTYTSSGTMVRYQTISAELSHRLSKRMNFGLIGSYRREREVEVQDSDRLDEYRISARISRQIAKEWALELRYSLAYLNAYQLSEDAIGNIIKGDSGNTEQSLEMRMTRYFGDA